LGDVLGVRWNSFFNKIKAESEHRIVSTIGDAL